MSINIFKYDNTVENKNKTTKNITTILLSLKIMNKIIILIVIVKITYYYIDYYYYY